MVISWNTTKTAKGFSFRVYSVEYAKPTTTLKVVDGYSSRAKAVTAAKKWRNYLAAQKTASVADRMDIQVCENFIGEYQAIDANTYDADHDQDGFFSTSPTGYGKTPLDAIVDLLDQMEG